MRLRRDSLARSRRRALERVAPGPLRDALVVPPPDADVVPDRLPLLALDVETTGLHADSDRVLSIGWVPVVLWTVGVPCLAAGLSIDSPAGTSIGAGALASAVVLTAASGLRALHRLRAVRPATRVR